MNKKNKGDKQESIELLKEMNQYFEVDNQKFNQPREEVAYIAKKLEEANNETKSFMINKFGILLTEHYLGKQKKLGNTFNHDAIEPFIIYLDRYLIEKTGGNLELLNKLGKQLTGEHYNLPTQRFMRLSILEGYFSNYLSDPY